jgi:hypothetical protein
MNIIQSARLTRAERKRLSRESRRAHYVALAWRRFAAMQAVWVTTVEQVTRPPRLVA